MLLPTVQFDDFEVWRCLKKYPALDKKIKEHPEGFIIKRKSRQPVTCQPGRIEGYGCQYGDYKISGDFRDSAK